MKRTLAGLAVLASALTGCTSQDDGSDQVAPKQPDATVTSMNVDDGAFCYELGGRTVGDVLLVEGIEVAGDPVTFRWSTASDTGVQFTSWVSRTPLGALGEGLVMPFEARGPEVRDRRLRAAWRAKEELPGAELEPGTYWLFTRARFQHAEQVGELAHGWESGGAPGTLTESWKVRAEGGCDV